MVQYQSFPGASGDSRTLDKLKKLGLPHAGGARFLDVGCNEGFFCGFAKFQGAVRSVGIDHSKTFIDRARQRFADCEFFAQDWDQLPEGEFDVILLASALHYAEDQPALIDRLMSSLSRDGVLVLEIGIVKSGAAVWTKVKRDSDERSFPSMMMLREVLKDYAWKWMGPSIPQDGDPVQRHVIHVRHRRPVAYLLMEPPGLGKSTIAGHLFAGATMPVVSNDDVMSQIGKGKAPASPELTAAISQDFSPFYLDKVVARVLEAGMIDELVGVWCAQAGNRDFVMDGFIPASQRVLVTQLLSDRGYLPVTLSWDRIGPPPPSAEAIQEESERFYLSLAQTGEAAAVVAAPERQSVMGFVDEAGLCDGQLIIRGWMVAPSGEMPKCLVVRLPHGSRVITVFERQQRPDVQKHFGLRHDLLGFRVSMDWAPSAPAESLRELQVQGGEDAEHLSAPFARAASLSAPQAD